MAETGDYAGGFVAFLCRRGLGASLDLCDIPVISLALNRF